MVSAAGHVIVHRSLEAVFTLTSVSSLCVSLCVDTYNIHVM